MRQISVSGSSFPAQANDRQLKRHAAVSMMPEGLLTGLTDNEVFGLGASLQAQQQVLLPD